MNTFLSRLTWPSFLLGSIAAVCLPSQAATFSISNLNDSGVGSLRQAIVDANAAAGADIISFTSGLSGTLTLTSGELRVSSDISVVGPGSAMLTISGGSRSRLFNITNGTVSLSDLTLSNGRVVGNTAPDSKGGDAVGGAILNAGTLDIARLMFSGNSAAGGKGSDGRIVNGTLYPAYSGGNARGGAIYNQGTLRVNGVQFTGNSAVGGDGGMGARGRAQGGNGGSAWGGAIFNAGPLQYTDVVFSGNTATGGMGGASGGAAGKGYAFNVNDDAISALNASFTAVRGRTFNGQLEVSGADLTYSALTYSIASGSLPAGLNLNSTTGVISGRPVVAVGGQTATFQVSNGNRTSTATVTFTVQAAPVDPLIVTTLSDAVDDFDNLISLPEAIDFANASSDADVITFSIPGTGAQTITLDRYKEIPSFADTTLTALPVKTPITITGPGADKLTLTRGASQNFNFFAVYPGQNFSISGLTLTNSSTDGAILNAGNATVSNCNITGNWNGGLTNSGTLRVANCNISGNHAYQAGGYYGGGGIRNHGTLSVSNCTVFGNTGGGIYNAGVAALNSCTVVSNSTGSGLYMVVWGSGAPTSTVRNCILAGNVDAAGTASDVGTYSNSPTPQTIAIVSQGYNLVGVGAINSFIQRGDRFGLTLSDLKLDSMGLRNNGGSTPTLALLAGSPALNAGNTDLTTDQRGQTRPFAGAADIGAFEAQSVLVPVDTTPPTLAITSPVGNLYSKTMPTISGTVSDVESGVASVKLVVRSGNTYWNGSSWVGTETALSTTRSGSTWSVSSGLPSGTTLASGTYELKAIATDVAGNVATIAQTLGIDTLTPTITFTSPVNGAIITSLSGIAGTVIDNPSAGASGIDRVTLSITRASDKSQWNGTKWVKSSTTTLPMQVSGSTWRLVTSSTLTLPTGSNLSNTQYQLVAVAYDKLGNSSQSSVVVTKRSSISIFGLSSGTS